MKPAEQRPDRVVDDAVEAVGRGEVVVVTDTVRDIGVAGLAGTAVTPQAVNFLVSEGRGILYAGLTGERLKALDVERSFGSDVMRSYVYVPVDTVHGVTTGISAEDRARTIQALVDPASQPSDFHRPGHVVPAAVDASGDVERFYLTESVQYLTTLAGLGDGVALAAVLDEDGRMATVRQLHVFADKHGCAILDFTDVLRAQRRTEGWARPWTGTRTVHLVHLRRKVAVRALDVHRAQDFLPVEVHDFCVRGHVLRVACPCRIALDRALERLEAEGRGAVAVMWPAEGGAVEESRCPDQTAVPQGLHDLVAADLAGARPAPLIQNPTN